MSEHSVLSASAAERWVACPISVLGEGSKAGRAAAEGTLGHSIADDVLRGAAYPYVGSKHTVEGFEFEIDDAFLADVAVYVDYIRNLPWIGAYQPEGKVNYSRMLNTAYNHAFGTTDCTGFIQDMQGRILKVVDLKMGRAAVNPRGNIQLALYAAGVLDSLYPNMILSREFRVELTIVQPRLSHKPFTWMTTVGWIEDTVVSIRPAAEAAVLFYAKKATADTFARFPEMLGDHCRYCSRKQECGAFQRKLREVATPGKAVVWDATLFALGGTVKSYFEDMEKMALDAALQGNPFPGTKLVNGRAGNPQFVIPRDDIRKWAKEQGVEEAVVKLEEVWATPAKVRDAFKALGLQQATLQTMIASPEGAPKLALADDPRAEVKKGADASAFPGKQRPQ